MKIYKFLILLCISLCLSSCEEILFEKDISNNNVKIVSPTDSSEISSSQIDFNWNKIEGASSYHIQIALPNFEHAQQIIVDTDVDDNSYTEDLPVNSYEWRVKAFNSAYKTSYTSAYFKVVNNEDFSSQKVNVISPEDNLVTNQNLIKLQWQILDGASMYRIQLRQDGELVDELITSENQLEINFPEGETIWKIRAENDTQNTFYSQRKVLVDTVLPNIPKLLKPADNSNLTSETVSFEWAREGKGGSVEKDSLFLYKDIELTDLKEKVEVINSYSTILDRQNTYYWFMQSYDEAGNKSEKSEIFSFTIN